MIVWLLAFTMNWAHAGYLKITSDSQLALRASNQGFWLEGTYEIENQGTEAAREVRPEFNIRTWGWRAEPVFLQAKEKHQWQISQLIPTKDLGRNAKGQVPVVIFHQYQDINAYPFAVPRVEMVWAGPPSDARPSWETKFRIEQVETGEFVGQIQITNLLDSELRLHPEYVVPKELEVLTPPVPLVVPPRGELETSFQFRNLKGLLGSHYQAFVVLQSESAGAWRTEVVEAPFELGTSPSRGRHWSLNETFWAWWSWAVGTGFVLMWAFWIRPLRRRNF